MALAFAAPANAESPRPSPPRLVVLVVLDPSPAAALPRMERKLGVHGLRRILDRGTRYPRAVQRGLCGDLLSEHALLVTGGYPSQTGVVAATLFDRAAQVSVPTLFDPESPLLDAEGDEQGGLSPRSLRVPAVGDLLKAKNPTSKVVAVAAQGPAAVLLGGREGKAYWLSAQSGKATTTRYYAHKLPKWLAALDSHSEEDEDPGPSTPARVLELAKAAVEAEQLGADAVPDFLGVSLVLPRGQGDVPSPSSHEAQTELTEVDRVVASLLDFLDQRVRQKLYRVVLTAGHVAPTPRAKPVRRAPVSRRIEKSEVRDGVEQALAAKWGKGPWVRAFEGPNLFLNRPLALERKVPLEELAHAALFAAAEIPNVAGGAAGTDLASGASPSAALKLAFDAERSGDVLLVPAESSRWEGCVGTPRQVPLAFFGEDIPKKRSARAADLADVAPTLASDLQLEDLSDAAGHPLPEVSR